MIINKKRKKKRKEKKSNKKRGIGGGGVSCFLESVTALWMDVGSVG